MREAESLGVYARAVRLGQALSGVRIVDCHTHLGVLAQLHVDEPEVAQLAGVMDRLGIQVSCPSAYMALGGDYVWGNDVVAAAMSTYPGRYLGYIVVNPNYPEDMLPELERCLARGPFIGIKLHPDYHDYPPDGPAYEPALAWVNERGMVALSHNWGSAAHLDRVAQRYPRVTFIQAHTGGAWKGRVVSDWLELARRQANVYLDVAISVTWYGALERLVKAVGSDKVLFGSDCPFIDPAVVLGRVACSRLPDAAKERILGANMDAILGRSGAAGAAPNTVEE
jgi:uncharacterized protein